MSCDLFFSQVKASLFAVGCFALLSEDFALITLEILLNIVGSSTSPFDVSIAAIHAIPRMQCSSTVASRAYKVHHAYDKKVALS